MSDEEAYGAAFALLLIIVVVLVFLVRVVWLPYA